MTDEAALMFRISIFALIAALAYFIVSREFLGTLCFFAFGLGPGFIGLLIVIERRHAHDGPTESKMDSFKRLAGLPRPDEGSEEDFAQDDVAVLPAPSIWPLIASLAFCLLVMGFLYGLWLAVIGIGLGLWSAVGWYAAVGRDHHAGNVEIGQWPTDIPEHH